MEQWSDCFMYLIEADIMQLQEFFQDQEEENRKIKCMHIN